MQVANVRHGARHVLVSSKVSCRHRHNTCKHTEVDIRVNGSNHHVRRVLYTGAAPQEKGQSCSEPFLTPPPPLRRPDGLRSVGSVPRRYSACLPAMGLPGMAYVSAWRTSYVSAWRAELASRLDSNVSALPGTPFLSLVALHHRSGEDDSCPFPSATAWKRRCERCQRRARRRVRAWRIGGPGL